MMTSVSVVLLEQGGRTLRDMTRVSMVYMPVSAMPSAGGSSQSSSGRGYSQRPLLEGTLPPGSHILATLWSDEI